MCSTKFPSLSLTVCVLFAAEHRGFIRAEDSYLLPLLEIRLMRALRLNNELKEAESSVELRGTADSLWVHHYEQHLSH